MSSLHTTTMTPWPSGVPTNQRARLTRHVVVFWQLGKCLVGNLSKMDCLRWTPLNLRRRSYLAAQREEACNMPLALLGTTTTLMTTTTRKSEISNSSASAEERTQIAGMQRPTYTSFSIDSIMAPQPRCSSLAPGPAAVLYSNYMYLPTPLVSQGSPGATTESGAGRSPYLLAAPTTTTLPSSALPGFTASSNSAALLHNGLNYQHCHQSLVPSSSPTTTATPTTLTSSSSSLISSSSSSSLQSGQSRVHSPGDSVTSRDSPPPHKVSEHTSDSHHHHHHHHHRALTLSPSLPNSALHDHGKSIHFT